MEVSGELVGVKQSVMTRVSYSVTISLSASHWGTQEHLPLYCNMMTVESPTSSSARAACVLIQPTAIKHQLYIILQEIQRTVISAGCRENPCKTSVEETPDTINKWWLERCTKPPAYIQLFKVISADVRRDGWTSSQNVNSKCTSMHPALTESNQSFLFVTENYFKSEEYS